MELRHLRTFLIVAETQNISEAARRLRVTQPALGRHIRDLEHTLGTALFVREPGRLRLTPAGRTLRERGPAALAAIEHALRRARGVGEEAAATVRVGYYGTMNLWAALIAPALEKLRQEFPRVAPKLLEASSAQLADDLREGRLDVSLVGPGDSARTKGIVATLAGRVPAVVIMPATHRLAGKRILALTDLREEEIVSFSPRLVPGRDRTLIACCRAAGFSPKITAIASALPELIVEVIARDGVAFVTPFARKAPHPGVVFVQLEPPGVPLEIFVACSLHAPPVARRLAEIMVAETQRVLSKI